VQVKTLANAYTHDYIFEEKSGPSCERNIFLCLLSNFIINEPSTIIYRRNIPSGRAGVGHDNLEANTTKNQSAGGHIPRVELTPRSSISSLYH
jgi:hypothetical protein